MKTKKNKVVKAWAIIVKGNISPDLIYNSREIAIKNLSHINGITMVKEVEIKILD